MKKYWKKNGFFLAVTLMAGILASVLASGIAIVLQKVVDVAVTKQTEAFGKLFLFAVGYILVLCVMNYTSALMEKYLSSTAGIFSRELWTAVPSGTTGKIQRTTSRR